MMRFLFLIVSLPIYAASNSPIVRGQAPITYTSGNIAFKPGNTTWSQIATPATPSAGFDSLYFKSDDKLYTLNSSGVETALGSGSGGGGITSLNTLTSSSQIFANGTSGLTPSFSSSVSTHTLNIPLAATTSVTAGLLSHADYATFSAAAPANNPSFTGTIHTPLTVSSVVKTDGSGNLTTGTVSLTGDVGGNSGATTIAASVVTGKALTGFVSGAGTVTSADTVLTGFNKVVGNLGLLAPLASPTFTGTIGTPLTVSSVVKTDSSGNLTTGTVPLSGDVGGNSGATTVAASVVTGKLLTGFSSAAGTVTSADSILTGFNKVVGNLGLLAPLASPTFTGTIGTTLAVSSVVKTDGSGNLTTGTVSLTGDVGGNSGATTISAATVTGKALTGFVSGAGTVTSADSILTGFNKLAGNQAAKAASGANSDITSLSGITGAVSDPTWVEFSNQSAAPANPSATFNRLYFKTDNNLYSLNSSGVETAYTCSGGGVAGSNTDVQFNNAGAFGADHTNFTWDLTNHRLGIGTLTPSTDLSFGGQAARTLAMERETTAATAGQSLTVQSGGAKLAGSNLAGGNLILSSGTATGSAGSKILLQAAPSGGGSGTTDVAPTTLATVTNKGLYVGTCNQGLVNQPANDVAGYVHAGNLAQNEFFAGSSSSNPGTFMGWLDGTYGYIGFQYGGSNSIGVGSGSSNYPFLFDTTNHKFKIPIGTASQQGSVPGSVYLNTTPVSNTSTTETTLISVTLGIVILNNTNDRIVMEQFGTFAANGNNKQVRVYYGASPGVLIYDSTSAAYNGGSWDVVCTITKTGASAENYVCKALSSATGATFPALSSGTLAFNTSGASFLKTTGTSGTGSNDITQNELSVDWWSAP